jgi:hypothetical protein
MRCGCWPAAVAIGLQRLQPPRPSPHQHAAPPILLPPAPCPSHYSRLGTGVDKDCISPVELKLPGGPERWRVIAVAAGGRHSLVLALPDSGNLAQRQLEWAQRKPLYSSPSPPPSTMGRERSWGGLADDEADEHDGGGERVVSCWVARCCPIVSIAAVPTAGPMPGCLHRCQSTVHLVCTTSAPPCPLCPPCRRLQSPPPACLITLTRAQRRAPPPSMKMRAPAPSPPST